MDEDVSLFLSIVFSPNSLQHAKDKGLAILWEASVRKIAANIKSPTLPVTAASVVMLAAGLTRKAKEEDG